MRYGLKLSQNAPIDEYRAVWRIADDEGFDSLWNMDHFATIGGDLTGEIFEAWTLLAAMAESTSRVRIGCMVTGNTYRHPGVLAKQAVTVDHLSGGRLEFGLGAAWAEAEHTMLGLEFGTVGQRMDRFAEALRIIKSLWTEPHTSFDGAHYQLAGAVAEPKPVQRPHPPIWVGGSGPRRTLRIVAEHADVWNANPAGDPEVVAEAIRVLDQHCSDVGRDPKQVRRTVQMRVSDNDEETLKTVEQFAEIGISEVIFVLRAEVAQTTAERVAALLPRLRQIG
jgi:F420-dependent oxidoreductase-like protein